MQKQPTQRDLILDETVKVSLKDLSDIADLICVIDDRKNPPSLENIGKCHELIIKMMGEHSINFYSADDGSHG
ncbi:MAG: hypothetical protein PHT07_20810 [Paludibacter sp.]|nr:hypothetical protein [Paludibacter sp.]